MVSCEKCRSRHIKCTGNGKEPCPTCRNGGDECYYPPRLKAGPRRGWIEEHKRNYSEACADLEKAHQRIRTLENHVTQSAAVLWAIGCRSRVGLHVIHNRMILGSPHSLGMGGVCGFLDLRGVCVVESLPVVVTIQDIQSNPRSNTSSVEPISPLFIPFGDENTFPFPLRWVVDFSYLALFGRYVHQHSNLDHESISGKVLSLSLSGITFQNALLASL